MSVWAFVDGALVIYADGKPVATFPQAVWLHLVRDITMKLTGRL